MSILQAAKVADPEAALVGLAAQVRVAPPGDVMVRVTEALLVVTVLPPASWTVTTGCVAKAVELAELEGLVVKTSLLAGPRAMVKVALTPLVSPPVAAVRV